MITRDALFCQSKAKGLIWCLCNSWELFVDIKWADNVHNNYIWSIVGEWRVVNCSVNDNRNVEATLWQDKVRKRTTDGERPIAMVSKNVFNVTDLRLNDMGSYYCKVCDHWKTPVRINVKRGTIVFWTMHSGKTRYFMNVHSRLDFNSASFY